MKSPYVPYFLWMGRSHHNKPVFGYYSGFSTKAKKRELYHAGIFKVRFYLLDSLRVLKPLATNQLITFMERLNTFLTSGIKINRAVFLMLLNSRNVQIKYICSKIITGMHSGKTPGESFLSVSEFFPPIFNAVVSVSDQTGNMAGALANMIVFYRTYTGRMDVIQKTMRYPFLVLSFVILLYYFILTFVVPSHRELYILSGGELPGETQLLLYISDVFSALKVPTALFFPISVAIWFVSRTVRKYCRRITENVMAGLTMNFKNRLLFVSTLKMLLRSRFNVDGSLEIIGKSFRGEIEDIATNIRMNIHSGMTLSEATKPIQFFGIYFNELITPAESTGNVPDALEKIEAIMVQEFNHRMQGIAFWLQPLLLLFVSALTVLLLLAVYRPLFNVGFTSL